jgi:hypothetical protein
LGFASPHGWHRRTLGISGKQSLASRAVGLDGRLGSVRGRGRPWAAPDGAARDWFGSVCEPKPVGRWDHRRGPLVDGVHDLGVVDAAQVHGRDPEVGMPQLPLYDHQRDALTRHLDRMRMPELMWR